MSKVTLAEFCKEWENQISKIETRALDDGSIAMIRLQFETNKLWFKMSNSERELEEQDGYLKLDMLEAKLEIALNSANSRFKLENRSIWSRAFNGWFRKVPITK